MHFTHIISDTHFHHEKIISLGERPFKSVRDMNEALVSNWNAVVPEDGVVLHLGDFSHDDVPLEAIRQIRSRLNGRILMTLGNHDFPEVLVEAGVVELSDLRLWFRTPDKDVVYSHFPLEPALLYSGRVSVHGHTHGPDPILDPNLHPGAISVNCELTGYAPLTRDEVMRQVQRAQSRVGTSWLSRTR